MKIRIETDGNPHTAKITDPETGKPLCGVRAVEFSLRYDQDANSKLTLDMMGVDVSATMDAEIHPEIIIWPRGGGDPEIIRCPAEDDDSEEAIKARNEIVGRILVRINPRAFAPETA